MDWTAASFSGLPSGSVPETAAVRLYSPPASALAVMVTMADAVGVKEPSEQVARFAAKLQEPLSVEAVSSVKLAGNCMLAVMPVACASPLLDTDNITVIVPPTDTGLGVSDIDTERSAKR
jgi:hypothetical protein